MGRLRWVYNAYGRVMAVTKESITVEQPELQLKGQQYGQRYKFWRRGREYFS